MPVRSSPIYPQPCNANKRPSMLEIIDTNWRRSLSYLKKTETKKNKKQKKESEEIN